MIERMKERGKLIRPLLLPLIIYVALLFLSGKWLSENPQSPWNILVALLPMLPGLVIARGVVRAILQLDEMQQQILLVGIAVSFAGTLILVLSMGLLNQAGVPQLNGVYIALFMVVLWFIGKLWATKKYQ